MTVDDHTKRVLFNGMNDCVMQWMVLKCEMFVFWKAHLLFKAIKVKWLITMHFKHKMTIDTSSAHASDKRKNLHNEYLIVFRSGSRKSLDEKLHDTEIQDS